MVLTTTAHDATTGANTSTAWARLYGRLRASQNLNHNILLLGANLGAGVCSYLMHSVLGHLLGLSGYGVVASMIALSAVFLMPQQIIGAVVTRYAAMLYVAESHDARLNDFVRRLTGILLPVGIGVAAALFAASGYISHFLQLSSPQMVFILSLMFAISFVSPVNAGAILGFQRFAWYSVLLVLPMFLRFVIASGLVALGFGLGGALLGIVLSSLLSYVASFQPLRAILKGPRLSCGSLRPLRSYSITATMTLASLVLFYNQDTLLAKHFLSASQAGVYAAVATSGNIIFIISSGVVTVVFPKFAAIKSRGERPTRVVLEAICGVLALSLVIETVFLAAPIFMVRMLFGSAFLAVSQYLLWYGLAMLLLAVAQVLIYYFLAMDDRLPTLTLFGASALQVLLFASRHQTVGQLVEAVMVTNGVLVIVLLEMFARRVRQTQ